MKIIYLRTSTEDQNPQNQLRDCFSIAGEEAKVIEERVSAWKEHANRGKFDEILSMIKRRQITDLYCWDLDRIYRNRKNLISFMKLCKHYDCKVHSYRQTWLEELNQAPQPFGEIMYDMMLNILGWLAEEESSKKSERVKSAFQNHKGKKWGRPTVKINRYEIMRLKKEGMSIRGIAAELQIPKSRVERCLKNQV